MGGFIRKLLGVDDPPPMQSFSELERHLTKMKLEI